MLSLASQPCTIWTFTRGIQSDLEGPFLVRCLTRFRRRLQSGWRISRRSRVKGLESHPTYSGVSALVTGTWYPWGSPLCSRRRVFDLSIARLAALLAGSWSQVLPDSRGFPKFSDGLLRDFERRPGKFVSCLLLLSSRDEEGFVRFLPFSPTGFFCVSVFPHVLRGGEKKIAVIDEFVRRVLRGF